MSGLRWLAGFSALMIWGPLAAQGGNPFDPRRVVAGPYAAATVSQESASKTLARKGILCGIEQTLDRARVCVDGEWMELSVFEARGGRKVKHLGSLSIVFQDGKSQQLGEALRSWKARPSRVKGEGK